MTQPTEQVYLVKQWQPGDRSTIPTCRRCHSVKIVVPTFRGPQGTESELCDACYETATDRDKAGRDRRNEERHCMLARSEVLVKECGIPPKYHGWKLSDWGDDVRAALLRVYAGTTPLVVLAGNTGTGKTSALYALLRFAWHQTFGANVPILHHWTAWGRMMHGRQFGGREGLREHKETIERMCSTPRLVMMDDIMSGGEPDRYTLLGFMEVLETREEWDRPTLLTTNLTPDEMSGIDDRLASRMAPGWVMLDDRDHRIKKKGTEK